MEVEPAEELRRQQRGERIPGGDHRRAEYGRANREVDRKGRQRDGGRSPPPDEQNCHHSNAGRGPDRGDLTVHQRQVQAEFGRQPVGRGHQRQPEELLACQTKGTEAGHTAEFGYQKSTRNLADRRKRFKAIPCRLLAATW